MAASNGMRGSLELLVLASLARGSAPGHALARRTGAADEAVYAALRRLESDRLVARTPLQRRVYRLTRRGRRLLGRELDEWRLLARAVVQAAA